MLKLHLAHILTDAAKCSWHCSAVPYHGNLHAHDEYHTAHTILEYQLVIVEATRLD